MRKPIGITLDEELITKIHNFRAHIIRETGRTFTFSSL